MTLDMMISDGQALLALRCLHKTDEAEGRDVAEGRAGTVPDELLARVHEVLSEVPETRADRVAQAKSDLADGMCSADDVAHKIIARVISDSLR